MKDGVMKDGLQVRGLFPLKLHPLKLAQSKSEKRKSQQKKSQILAGLTALIVSLAANPAWAGDPFRSGSNARPISATTEAVFTTVFQRGDYVQGRQMLTRALPTEGRKEPLIPTLAAGLSFLDEDWAGVKRYALQTQQVGQQLVTTDPLRGNLYQAVGEFLLGVHEITPGGSGPVLGIPNALLKVQEMFKYMDQAKAIDPNDPEYNLLQGFVEWGLANSLGLFNADQAAQRLSTVAAPNYVSWRGAALVFRDQKRYDQALAAIDRALQAAPENPELIFTKAQILRSLQNNAESLKLVDQALVKQNQLPKIVVKEMTDLRTQLQQVVQVTTPQNPPLPEPKLTQSPVPTQQSK
jgi:tetratricopeptide (TPR) repeat protein